MGDTLFYVSLWNLFYQSQNFIISSSENDENLVDRIFVEVYIMNMEPVPHRRRL